MSSSITLSRIGRYPRSPAKIHPRWRHQTGANLVEVLVTLVLTSAGLLGVSALQLVSLKGNQAAQLRATATALATSMLDRVRSNHRGFERHEYDEVEFNAVGHSGTRTGADLSAWQQEIDQHLPGGAIDAAGAIHRTVGTNILTITIRWGTPSVSADSVQIRTEI